MEYQTDRPVSEAEEAHYEELEAEQARLAALPRFKGHRAVSDSHLCDQCGKGGILYEATYCTLGHPGHPGAEFTSFQLCARCLA